MYQTRSSSERDVQHFSALSEAFEEARRDRQVWKISFNAQDGTRIRLLRTEHGWVYEDVYGNREN